MYVEDGEVRAEHSFWVFRLPFLILQYRIRPREEDRRAVTRAVQT